MPAQIFLSVRTQSCKWEANPVARAKPYTTPANQHCFRHTEQKGLIWLAVELKYQQPYARVTDCILNCTQIPSHHCGVYGSITPLQNTLAKREKIYQYHQMTMWKRCRKLGMYIKARQKQVLYPSEKVNIPFCNTLLPITSKLLH